MRSKKLFTFWFTKAAVAGSSVCLPFIRWGFMCIVLSETFQQSFDDMFFC